MSQASVNWPTLVAKASLGELKPADMVWSQELPAWQPAQSFPNLVFSGSHEDRNIKWIMPVNVSGWAIASGYLGLFAVIAIGAPFAVITGILALRDIKLHPGRNGKGRAIFGLVMGVIFSLLYGLLIATMISNKSY